MQFSVVIPTRNRANTLPRAVESVLTQIGPSFDLVIVDDGSTDETGAYLDGLADPRVTTIHADRRGAAAARNTGIAAARGDWIAFLDDDDAALPGWLSNLAGLIDDSTAIVCCAAVLCDPDGRELRVIPPMPLGPLFADQVGCFLTGGTFATRADLLRAIGGYDELLVSRQQIDLAVRLVPAMIQRGMHIHCTDLALVRVERRQRSLHPMIHSTALYAATKRLLHKHRDLFARDPQARAETSGVLGVAAARLRNWPEARSALLASAMARPLWIRAWLRLAVACFPPLGGRIWLSDGASHDSLPAVASDGVPPSSRTRLTDSNGSLLRGD